MNTRDIIATILTNALAPARLEVVDESHLHAGHMGARAGGQTHYRVRITASAFEGQSRLARHRTINDLLAVPLQAGVHALAIEARAPSEQPQA